MVASSLQLPSQASSSRRPHRRCRDSVEVLMEEAKDMTPTTRKRGLTPIDEVLVSGKETPGLRLKYRMNQSIVLDYGNRWDELDTTENYLISKSFINSLFESTTTCKNCNFILKFEEVDLFSVYLLFIVQYDSNCIWTYFLISYIYIFT